MAKNPSNGNVKVGWILDSALTESEFPLAATLNTSALDLSAAIAWQDYEVGASDSPDTDDRSLVDLGNAVSRGAASYGATLSLFRDKDSTDVTSIYVQGFEAFRVERTLGWLVVRVNKSNRIDWEAGDEISLFKLIADSTADDSADDDSVKFTVQFLPQAELYVHTVVGGAGIISGIAATNTKTVAGGAYQLAPVLAGTSIVSRAIYTSSDRAVATVSIGGTVSPLSAGVATISVSHGAATATVEQELTVTSA